VRGSLFTVRVLRIAWLTTGRGPGSFGALQHLFAAIDRRLPVELAVVFINRDPGEAEPTDRLIAMVQARGIPVESLSSVRFRKSRGGALSRPGEPLPPWRKEYDTEVARLLGRHRFDLGVMFGYMLIATEPLYGSWTFLNDHPALPNGPVGTWQQVICELIRSRAEESGCMWNVVTGDVDRGPVVSFCRYPIAGPDMAPLWAEAMALGDDVSDADLEATRLFQEIRRRGVLSERPLMVETLRAIAEGRLHVPPQGPPADLTADVDRAIRAME
jgi:folate-dependent phosphoribosylglycinamide formyltransferase PurN